MKVINAVESETGGTDRVTDRVACLAQLNSPERLLVLLVFVFTCIRSSTSHDAREYCGTMRVVVIAGLHGLTYKCAILIDNSACLIASVSVLSQTG